MKFFSISNAGMITDYTVWKLWVDQFFFSANKL